MIALAAVVACCPPSAQDPGAVLRGTVVLERPAGGACHVAAWAGSRDERSLRDLTPAARARVAADGAFELATPAGSYTLFAFADRDGDGAWTPAVPEPCAFARGVAAPGTATLVLRAPTHLPREERTVPHGALRWRDGLPVVQLWGDARERGMAHGLLLAPQIVDLFRYYVLEDCCDGADGYRAFARFLESHFAWPEPFLREVDGVLDGMRASGADLVVPELGAAFSRTELLAINAYVETRAMRSSCTQFAAWGTRTAGTDVDGGTIAARNMDGEIDVRRVTVSHFVLFAVAPGEPGQRRFVSAMWPGFVGTLSGFNDAGVHCMENAGGSGPGPVVAGLQPISWTMRQALATFGGDATPTDFERLLAGHANERGGACGPGCIVLFALPQRTAATPAWVLEGDRFGHVTRRPGEVAPRLPELILASNHHLRYGVDAQRGGPSFGREPGFSSRWRYEAARQKLEAWARTGRGIGTREAVEILQTVAHGTTEHAVITRPDRLELDVAVASMRDEAWDAPYRAWVTFRFADLFDGVPGPAPVK